MSILNDVWDKIDKKWEFHDKVILSQKANNQKFPRRGVSLRIYIHTYINPQTQSSYHTITYSYTVHQPQPGGDCKYNQCAWLKLSMGDKYNDIVIVNPK